MSEQLQIIFDGLRSLGLNEIAAAAIMGNMEAESNMVPNRLQGDFTNGYTQSAAYTEKVDNGTYSRSSFINDGKGYGLCQWTYSTRKAALYDYAKAQGMSVGSLLLQLAFVGQELSGEFVSVKTALNAAENLYDATAIVLRKYEMPYDQSDNAAFMRTAKAQFCLENVNVEAELNWNQEIHERPQAPSSEQPSESEALSESEKSSSISSNTLGEAVENTLTQAANNPSGSYRISAVIVAEDGEYKIKELRMEACQ